MDQRRTSSGWLDQVTPNQPEFNQLLVAGRDGEEIHARFATTILIEKLLIWGAKGGEALEDDVHWS